MTEFRSIRELTAAFRRGDFSPWEWARQIWRQVESEADRFGGFTVRCPEHFLEAARQSETRYVRRRPLGPLDGVVIGLKDMITTREMPTTAGSRILADYRPAADARVVERLKASGANYHLGKLNLHEFAYGPTGTSSFFGATGNPWDPTRMAGGSSSGSALAVQRNWVSAALGTDTGGSVRIPAALSGVIGLKPTYGAVSVQGVIPLAWSLDHVGILGRTATDVRTVYWALTDAPGNALTARPRRFRVLWPDNLGESYQAAIDTLARQAVHRLSEAGWIRADEGPLPEWEALAAVQHVVLSAEASTFHWAWLRERAADYQPDVRERLETRSGLLAMHYIEALRQRRRSIANFSGLWGRYDLIVMPTVPITAPLLTQTTVSTPTGVREDVRVSLVKYTAAVNALGAPAIAHPVGMVDGLPVSLQWIAPPGREDWLLDVVEEYQTLSDWHLRMPKV